MEPHFDLDGVFDDDYLHFYAPMLEERTDDDVATIRELGGVRSGMRVLDAPCGHGRIANRLAALGCDVVGVDRSQAFLDVATADAPGANAPTYQQGDLRHLPVSGKFDVVVCWFSSFGYFADDADNRRVLEQFRAVLRHGGRLLLEQANPLQVLRGAPVGRSLNAHVARRGEDLVIDEVTWDVAFGRSVVVRTIVRDGRVRTTNYALRMLTPPEMRAWLDGAGFREVVVEDETGGPLTLSSGRMLVRATA